MGTLEMVLLAPFYVMVVVGTAIAAGASLMYFIDAIRKQLQS